MKKIVFTTLLAGSLFTFGAAFTAMPKAPVAGIEAVSGTVIETMNSAGYTYMLIDVEDNDGDTWVAIPETSVQKGAKVTYTQGMEMKNFHSTTLDRTFPSIIFSTGLAGGENKPAAKQADTKGTTAKDSFNEAVAAEQKAAPTKDAAMEQSGGSAGAVAPFAEIKVDKAEGANSCTVGEVFEKSKELNGKKLKIRGKVVKFNAHIMGRNWIHLQDGTGNPMNNSHDLVVTTSAEAQVNDIVIAEGILAADKDFGAGYAYSAILENSTLTK